MNDEYRKYGRRKAGTYGKPHKGNRKAANRAVRTRSKGEIAGMSFADLDAACSAGEITPQQFNDEVGPLQ